MPPPKFTTAYDAVINLSVKPQIVKPQSDMVSLRVKEVK